MIDALDPSLIDWSRAQFALTAMYHWLFVPLTLGLGILLILMEAQYCRSGSAEWRSLTRFWMKLFGINFAMGVATGLILEFEFGTNWSNYSWFVGDIFGAPLAIEGIVAFFLEATFLGVMFFGWEKVSRRMHFIATCLTVLGATLSAWWILVANAWMQYPVGMRFSAENVRNEMTDFCAVAFSPVAVTKFCHTVSSSWLLGAVFVLAVSCFYLLRRRCRGFALRSIRLAAPFGLAAALLCAATGHWSACQVAKLQPMKLAAAEGLLRGGDSAGFVLFGLLRPDVDWSSAENSSAFLCRAEFPSALSLLATGSSGGYVPGIRDILEGGYETAEGKAPSAWEMISRGRRALAALAAYRQAPRAELQEAARRELAENFPYFGYGYLESPADLLPPVAACFYSFRLMLGAGGVFLLLFLLLLLLGKRLVRYRFLQVLCLLGLPLAYLASEAGWLLAEAGRQPWVVQGLLPNRAAVSRLDCSAVQTSFFLFLCLFSLLLAAELLILAKAIAHGPEKQR